MGSDGAFGSGFETPIFRFSQLEVKSFSLLSGGHIKLSVMDRETQKRMDALWFSPAKNHSVNVNNFAKLGQVVDLLGEPQWNILLAGEVCNYWLKTFVYPVRFYKVSYFYLQFFLQILNQPGIIACNSILN